MNSLRPSITAMAGLVPVLLAAAVPSSAQQLPLRWKYQPGMELVYRMTQHQETSMPMIGGSAVVDHVQTIRWRVADVATSGDATITVVTERVQFDSQTPMGNVTYDSESGEEPTDPQARIMSAMVGASYTIVIGSDGRVKSVGGLDQLQDAARAELSPEAAGTMGAMFDQMLSEESMTRMMQQGVQMFPERPVGPGDSWPHSFSMPLPLIGTMTTNQEYRVTAFEQREGRTVAVIAATGTITFDTDESSQLPASISMGDTGFSGNIDFDVDRGVTLASDISMSMDMSIAAGGQEMVMGTTQRIKVELVEFSSGR